MGLSVTITNLSAVQWERNNWHVGAGSEEGVNWTDEVTQVPVQTLVPRDGASEAAASTEHLAWLVQDALWMTLGYGSSEGDFAVSTQQLFHMFGIGKQCQWQVWKGTQWGDWTTDALPYEWTFAGTLVRAVPTLSDSAASVNIVITDVRKPHG